MSPTVSSRASERAWTHWVQLRLALFSSLVISAAILALTHYGAHLMFEGFARETRAIGLIEQARMQTRALAVIAVHTEAPPTPMHEMVTRGKLQEGRRKFRQAVDRALAAATVSTEVLAAVLDTKPHELARNLEALEAEVAALAAMPNAPEAAGRVRRIERLADRAISRGLDALLAAQTEANLALRRNLENAALAMAALAGLIYAALWGVFFRPLARKIEHRTQALVAANRQIAHGMLHDRLTGLANRRKLMEFLRARRQEGPVAVLYLDLLQFREVNDTFGWKTGDRALHAVGDRLRDLAGRDDLVARLDADDFVIATAAPENAEGLAGQAIAALSAPISHQDQMVELKPVIGLASCSGKAEKTETLLANADIALARARLSGQVVVFTDAMRAELAKRRRTVADLTRALEQDEIEPHYQPQIDAGGRVIGLEALIRWRHPGRGILGPQSFLEIAEQANLGLKLYQAMIVKTLAALAGWRAEGVPVPQIGVNLTAQALRDPDIVDLLQFDLDRHGLMPGDICIEVLETALIERDDDPIVATINRLSQIGFHIDLDDFGTGHAAISNVARLAVDRLKIDRSFVSGVDRRQDLRQMVRAMIQMARALDISVLAEGVETEAEMRTLTGLGCQGFQGYAIAKPMPESEIAGWIAGRGEEGLRATASPLAAS